MPEQPHQHRRHSHVRAGKGCRGALAGFLGSLDELVAHAVDVARRGQTVLMVVEVVVHGWEDGCGYLLQTHGLVVERRSDDRHEDEYHVEEKERCQEDKRGALELVVPPEEVVEHHQGYHGVVGTVAEVEKLTDNGRCHLLAEQQCRLATEPRLLDLGKDVVQVLESAVQLVGVRIPPGQQQYLRPYACEARQGARHQPVDKPQRGGHGHYAGAPHKQGGGVLHLCV